MARDAKQTNEYDYEVEMIDLFTPEGKKTGVKASRRTDDGIILGTMTEHYGMVQNGPLVNKTEDAFRAKGLTNYERKVIVTGGGARMRVVYDFPEQNIDIPQVGDSMGMRLILQNSFDRSLRLSFALGLLRLVCTNGMKTLEKEFDLTRKHSTKIDADSLLTGDALDKAITAFKNSGDKFAELAKAEITQDQGLGILQNLAKKNTVSEKMRGEIATIWNNPTHEEDSGRNLYNLYNATTQHLTGNYEERFEYADRVSGRILNEFSLASRNPKRLQKLSTFVAPEGVAVANN